MLPTFKPGEDIFVWRWGSPKIGDVVVLNNSASHYHTLTYNSVAFLVKRVKEIKNDKYFVVGDNEQASTDSRKFGWVERKEIVGVVIK